MGEKELQSLSSWWDLAGEEERKGLVEFMIPHIRDFIGDFEQLDPYWSDERFQSLVTTKFEHLPLLSVTYMLCGFDSEAGTCSSKLLVKRLGQIRKFSN